MTILERLKKVMEEQNVGGDVEITMDTTFEELEIDSLDLVDLTMNCEDEFGIDLDPDSAPKTIGELVEKIAELTGEEA